ncbi:hypothetical protein CHUAL_009861 [Chamberlinius hualienensis]
MLLEQLVTTGQAWDRAENAAKAHYPLDELRPALKMKQLLQLKYINAESGLRLPLNNAPIINNLTDSVVNSIANPIHELPIVNNKSDNNLMPNINVNPSSVSAMMADESRSSMGSMGLTAQ